MKREFLQELRVNGEALPKAVIDAIMAENGRDIEAAKASADGEALRREAQQLREKLTQAEQMHAQQLADMAFQNSLTQAVNAAQGRSCKAISALLDIDAIRAAEDPETALQAAIEALKEKESYLFGTVTPPPYASGTGKQHYQHQAPDTLAGALREKFERK